MPGESAPKISQEILIDSSVINEPLVLKYKPQLISHGGDNIVFDIQDLRYVAKVSYKTLQLLVERNLLRNLPANSIEGNTTSEIQRYFESESTRFRALRSYFHNQHVPKQIKRLCAVPLSHRLQNMLFHGEHRDAVRNFPTVVTVQEKVRGLGSKGSTDICSGYAEHEGSLLDPSRYKEVTNQLLSGQKVDILNFFGIQPMVAQVIRKMWNDPVFKETVRSFVESAIKYSNETGETLDLAGSNNVYISKNASGYTCTLLDALYPGTSKLLPQFEATLARINAGDTIERSERSVILNTLNYVRTINALAQVAGVTERIILFASPKDVAEIDFLALLAK
jgi:hypothetical protein